MTEPDLRVIPLELELEPPRAFVDPILAPLPPEVGGVWCHLVFTTDRAVTRSKDCFDPQGRWHWGVDKVDPVLGAWRTACLDEALGRFTDWAKQEVRRRRNDAVAPNVLDATFEAGGTVVLRWLRDPQADARKLHDLLKWYPESADEASPERVDVLSGWAQAQAAYADPDGHPDFPLEPVDPDFPAGRSSFVAPDAAGDAHSRPALTEPVLLSHIASALMGSGPAGWRSWTLDASVSGADADATRLDTLALRYRLDAASPTLAATSRLQPRIEAALVDLRRLHGAAGTPSWQRIRLTQQADARSIDVAFDPAD